MRPKERMKPQVQTTRQSSNDITAHAGGDATIAVWHVYVSQFESEHLLDCLSVMPMQQLQSCVVAPCPTNPRWHDMAHNRPHTFILNVTLQYPRCLTNAQAREPPTRAAVHTESRARMKPHTLKSPCPASPTPWSRRLEHACSQVSTKHVGVYPPTCKVATHLQVHLPSQGPGDSSK